MLSTLLVAVPLMIGGGEVPPPPPVTIIEAVTISRSAPAPAIEEDEPGWDCHTMGNRICGPVAVTPIVVHMESEAGVVEYADEAVSFDTGDGIATVDRATYDRLVAVASQGETDDEYYARLNQQYCDAKPWLCEGE